jgi:predicted nucleotidyltransferase
MPPGLCFDRGHHRGRKWEFKKIHRPNTARAVGCMSIAPIAPSYPIDSAVVGNQLDGPNLGPIISNMGNMRSERISLSSALFSNVQQRVLGLIFGHPERSFYISEIVRNVNSGTGAVDRELSRLQRSGLVSVQRIGNQKHYRANPKSPIFEELQSLVLKTVGLAGPLADSLKHFSDKLKVAFVFGSVAKGADTARSDIDLLVIGNDLDYSDLYTALQDAENKLARKVNPLFLTVEDWRRKVSQKDSFIQRISTQPKIFILGSGSDLQA